MILLGRGDCKCVSELSSPKCQDQDGDDGDDNDKDDNNWTDS